MTGRILKIAIIVFIMLFASQFLLFSADTVKWESDWQSVLKTAAEKKQPVLMDFYTDWCPHCKRLDAITFIDKTVIDYFNKENYALLKVNPEIDRAAEEKFKVFSYPTMVIFKPDGSEVDRMLGFKSPEELINDLENLKKGIGTLDDLLGKLTKFKPEDNSDEKFKLMFGINDKYIAGAHYPDALTMIERIILLDKDNGKKQASSAMYQRGYIYYKWKKYKEAVDALTSIHTVYPQSEEAEGGYGAAAYYSEKLNDPALTLKLLKEFVTKFSNSENLERIQKKIKKLEEQ